MITACNHGRYGVRGYCFGQQLSKVSAAANSLIQLVTGAFLGDKQFYRAWNEIHLTLVVRYTAPAGPITTGPIAALTGTVHEKR